MRNLKNILIVLLLFTASITSSQVIQIGNTVLNKGAKGQDGGTLENEVTILTETDLINTDNANKNYWIPNDITLTANRTLPSNVTFIGGGGMVTGAFTLTGNNTSIQANSYTPIIDGNVVTLAGTWKNNASISLKNFNPIEIGNEVLDASITAGGNTVTSATANFTANDVDKFITVNKAVTDSLVFRSTITAYISPTQVTVADNANLTVSNQKCVYGYDNMKAFDNANFVRNQEPGDLIFNNVDAYFSAKAMETLATQDAIGYVLGYADNIRWIGNGAKLRVIPHSIPKTRFIRVYKTKNYVIYGINVIGDELEDRGRLTYGKEENSHGIELGTLAYNGIIENCNTYGWHGDGIYASGNTQFTNSVKGDGTGDSNIALGYYDETGTLDAGNTNYAYSSTLLPLTGTVFDNSKYHDGLGFFALTGGSYYGWSDLYSPYYWALFYDASGTFIEKSQRLNIYDKITLDPAWKQIRILFEAPAVLTNIDLRIRPDLVAEGLYINHTNSYKNGREGASNLPSNTTWMNSDIYENGGIVGGPGYGINNEDRKRYCKNIHFENLRLWGNWGDISIIDTENVTIKNCKFLNTPTEITVAPTNYPHIGIGASTANHVIIEGNIFYNKQITTGRQDKIFNNKIVGGILYYEASANIFENNECTNLTFKSIYDATKDKVGYPTIIKGNKLMYNQSTGVGYYFQDFNNASSFIDNDFIFNSTAEYSFETPLDYLNIYTGDSGNDRLFLRSTPTVDLGGVWTGNTFKGMLPSPSTRDYSTGTAKFPLTTYKGNAITHPMEFDQGIVKDYDLMYDCVVNGYLLFKLSDFEDTVISATPTIKIEKTPITIGSDYAWTNTGAALVETPLKNVNFEFIDVDFNLEVATSVTATTNKFLDFDHLGTTLLDNCSFKSISAITIDFTNTSIFPATLGAVTIIDPTVTNITFTLRSQDHVVFTKASPLMATYATFADDAAATTAGYPTGYWYMTSTGELRVKL